MAEFPYSPGLYKLSHQGKQLLRHSRTFPEGSLKSCCSFRKILRKPRSTLSRSRIQMFGGHMKRIGIMGTAIMSLLLAAGVPGHAQQAQPNRKQDREQKDENRGRPEEAENRPQANQRRQELSREQRERAERQQQQLEQNRQGAQYERQQELNHREQEEQHLSIQRQQELSRRQQQERAQQRQTQIEMNQRQAQRERDRQQQMQQQRLSQERQAQLIQRQQIRVAEYRRNLEEQQRRLQWQTEQLQRQRRLAQYRFQREYLEHLRQEEIRIRQARYDYYSDPYFYSPPIYRYYRGGSYYDVNQYGADLLRRAVNYGYREGYRAGVADREDRWNFDYRDSYAYQDANYGYDGYCEDQGAYNYYFREGFRRGYEDGYYSRYQYGTYYNGEYSVLGAVLGQILNFVALR